LALSDLVNEKSRLISNYDVNELERIVQDRRYHSPERSPERSPNSSFEHSSDEIIVYDLSWRSEKVSFGAFKQSFKLLLIFFFS